MPRGLQLLTPPGGEPLSLAEAKNWIRVDTTQDDFLIGRSIRSARAFVENAYNRTLVSRQLQTNVDRFPRYSSSAVWQYNSDAIWQQRLPVTQLSGQWYPDRAAIRVTRPPMQQLSWIIYTDGNGVVQMLVDTVPAGIAATGSQVVTPATMVGITTGLALIVDVGSAQETVAITQTTPATFTASFANTHPPYVLLQNVPAGNLGAPLQGGALVNVDTSTEPARIAPGYGQIWPIVRQQLATVRVAYWAGYGPVTTIPLGVPGSGSMTVTPASMNGIFPGIGLAIDTMNNWEQVFVTAITATTFTAAFAQPHAAAVVVGPGLSEDIREALLMMMEHRYRNRGAVMMGAMDKVPLGLESALAAVDCWEYE